MWKSPLWTITDGLKTFRASHALNGVGAQDGVVGVTDELHGGLQESAGVPEGEREEVHRLAVWELDAPQQSVGAHRQAPGAGCDR
jgi:hypothetical protein